MKSHFLYAVAGVLIAGCIPGMPTVSNEPKPMPMAERSPEFGSTSELGTLQNFAVGRWSTVNIVDPNIAKQYGLDALEPMTADTTSYWEFKADGRMVFRLSGVKDVVDGKWQVQGDAITIQYLTMGGKTLEAAQSEIKKHAETGAQSAIAEDMHAEFIFQKVLTYTTAKLHQDMKHLYFEGVSGGGLGDGGMPTASQLALERWGPLEAK